MLLWDLSRPLLQICCSGLLEPVQLGPEPQHLILVRLLLLVQLVVVLPQHRQLGEDVSLTQVLGSLSASRRIGSRRCSRWNRIPAAWIGLTR